MVIGKEIQVREVSVISKKDGQCNNLMSIVQISISSERQINIQIDGHSVTHSLSISVYQLVSQCTSQRISQSI